MKIFIPTNEASGQMINKGYSFKPLIIEAYEYHFDSLGFENTQNLLSKKVKTGIVRTRIGKAAVE